MKFNVIGKYGRYAPQNEATNCYLIQTDNGKNIVIDLGAGALSGLQKYINISDISMVIITHLHFDHSSDLGVLSYALGYLKLNNIKVLMPRTPEIMCDAYNAHNFDIEYLDENTRFVVDNVQFEFAKSPHPVETYSVIISYNGKKIVYTSDCQNETTLKENTKGADIVIGDACILEENYSKNCPHVSVKRLVENLPIDCKVYLAHLTCGDEQMILKEGQQYHDNVEIVRDFEV